MLTAFVLVVNGVLNSLLKASLILSLRVQRARMLCYILVV